MIGYLGLEVILRIVSIRYLGYLYEIKHKAEGLVVL